MILEKEKAKHKAVFFDRDGIINQEKGDYVYTKAAFEFTDGLAEAVQKLKAAGFYLIVVTNQGGIAKGLYTKETVMELHEMTQKHCQYAFDQLYYSPYHKSVTLSLLSKPNSMMFEKGIAKFDLDPEKCWLIGDAERDLVAAQKVGVKGILVPTLKETESEFAFAVCKTVPEAVEFILTHS